MSPYTLPHEYLSNKNIDVFYYDRLKLISVLKRELLLLFLLCCLVLASVPTASCRTTAPTVYVSGDGSGDFNCDGVDDHVQINQALKFVAENPEYTTVYLKGPFTYYINDTLLIGSNTILEGDSTAVVKLVNNAGWDTMKPLIQQMNGMGNSNIIIRGFEIDVNHDGNTEFDNGNGYYNVIYLLYCNNVRVYNMHIHDGHGDGLRIKYGKDIQFYNNKIYKLGHDAFFSIKCENVEAYNNKITCRTNSALRIWNSKNVKFYDNMIDSFYSWDAGGPGIQIEKSEGAVENVEIYNNTINNTYGPGVWLFNYDKSPATRDQAKNINIHHNVFYNTGTNPSLTWVGGIVSGGFDDILIENNVFDGIYHAAIAQMYISSYSSDYSPASDGYTATVRNNIIVNSQKHAKDSGGIGYGVLNNLPETHTFVLENNCLYNNTAGKYKNCSSTTDIYVEPLFADQKNHDYHLQSTAGRWTGKIWVKDKVISPCIDAGYPASDYSNEPENNGSRINIGRYGNTIYASLSNTPPELDPIPSATANTGENLSFIVKASDLDGDNLVYSVSPLPEGASFDEKTGVFSWVPNEKQAGIYDLLFKVSDGKLNDSQTAKLTIVKEATPPELSGTMYDNRLREISPEEVLQDKPFIDVGGMNNGGYRGIIWFNLSKYSDTTEIKNATLSLFWYYPPNSRLKDTVVEIYRPVSSWNPEYASWNKKDEGIAWKNSGGDWYDKNGIAQGKTPYATITLKGSELPNNRYYELNVTDLVKEYVNGKYANTGFLIKASNETDNYIAFYSNESGNESQKPKLAVTKKSIENATINGAKDNRLREASPDEVFQYKPFLDIGGMNNSRYRDLIAFNLSRYPSSTKINKATLSLFWYYPPNSRLKDTVVEIYRPVSSWNPEYASWNKKDEGIAWKNSGGDWYDKNGIAQGKTPYATITLKGSELPNNRYFELNVTDLVKEYVSGKYANTGFLIKASNESDNYVAFYSNESGNESQIPKLDLAYS